MAGDQAPDAVTATAQPHAAEVIPQGPATTEGQGDAGTDGTAVKGQHPSLDALPDSPGGLAPADLLQEHNPLAPDHNARWTDSASMGISVLSCTIRRGW